MPPRLHVTEGRGTALLTQILHPDQCSATGATDGHLTALHPYLSIRHLDILTNVRCPWFDHRSFAHDRLTRASEIQQ